MNAMVGDAGNFSQTGTNLNNPGYVQFFKAFTIPRPSDIFVFLDEHPDSIDDGYFLNREVSPASWNDLPASYHDGAASFSFADGHSEIKKWRDQKVRGCSSVPSKLQRDSGADALRWLQDRSTRKLSGQ